MLRIERARTRSDGIDDGQLTMDDEQLTMDNGQWTIVESLRDVFRLNNLELAISLFTPIKV